MEELKTAYTGMMIVASRVVPPTMVEAYCMDRPLRSIYRCYDSINLPILLGYWQLMTSRQHLLLECKTNYAFVSHISRFPSSTHRAVAFYNLKVALVAAIGRV